MSSEFNAIFFLHHQIHSCFVFKLHSDTDCCTLYRWNYKGKNENSQNVLTLLSLKILTVSSDPPAGLAEWRFGVTRHKTGRHFSLFISLCLYGFSFRWSFLDAFSLYNQLENAPCMFCNNQLVQKAGPQVGANTGLGMKEKEEKEQ